MMRILLLLIALSLHSICSAQTTQDNEVTQAWRSFTAQLESAGVEILNSYPQPEAVDSAEGLRYLLQQLGSSLQQKLVKQPGQIPLLRIGATTINKWGMDGADAKYQGAAIDGNASYRFYGRLGTARLFALQLANMEGTYAAFGAVTGEQLGADDAGNFELLISPQKPDDWRGAWLALNPESSDILVREYFSDWRHELPGRYHLERLGSSAAAAPLGIEQAASLLDDTAATFANRAPQWRGRVDMARKHLVNKVHVKKSDGQGLASNYYGSGWFEVGLQEALIIEMEAPNALLWSVQLGNIWWESIDYINHTASLNDSQAVASSDGKYRFVIAHRDPGVANWLDPAGHVQGAILFRLQKAEAAVQPMAKLIPVAELTNHLPADISAVTASQRREEITMRRNHAAIRWAP
jgi:hypothetical protein